jgi:DNA-binding HxlR family transcriptional regulator
MTQSVDSVAPIEPAPNALAAPQCHVARCAEVITGKWTLLIVRELAPGPRYFNELEKGLPGMSPRTLCERLKLLAAHGLITRTRIKGLPPRTTYELTPNGRLLLPIIDTMREVGEILAEATSAIEVIDPCSDEL